MCKILKRGIVDSIDEILLKVGIESDVNIKIFGQPIEEFDLEDMNHNEIKDIRKVLLTKIDNLAV